MSIRGLDGVPCFNRVKRGGAGMDVSYWMASRRTILPGSGSVLLARLATVCRYMQAGHEHQILRNLSSHDEECESSIVANNRLPPSPSILRSSYLQLHIYRLVKPQDTIALQHTIHTLRQPGEGIGKGVVLPRLLVGLIYDEGQTVGFDRIHQGWDNVLEEEEKKKAVSM